MKKSILFLQYTNGESCRKMLKGAQKYAVIKNQWELGTIENCKNIPSIKELLKFWQPDGCIVDCGGIDGAFNPKDFGGIPLVMLNRSANETKDCIPSVFHNQGESSKLAIKELLRLSRKNLAFVSWIKNIKWSQLRESEFIEAMNIHGFAPHVFHAWKLKRKDTHSIQPELRDYLGKMPLPCAVFAANDRMAREVIASAHAIGLSIPSDIAVVGIDNNEMIALSTTPSLTTVEVNFEKAGFMAAELLDQVMSADTVTDAKRHFGPLRLVRRGSTAIIHRKDSCVEQACEHIRLHCTDGISAKDVAALFPSSRRTAEMRFRAATGHSIGDEILDTRMEIVKSYLRSSDIELESLAQLSGWKSPAVLRQYFKRKTGMTLSAYRKTALEHHGA